MELNQTLSTIAQLLLIIALPIVIAAAIQTFRVQTQRLKDNIGEERFNALRTLVQSAVHMAEQMGIIDQLAGPEKRQRAIEFVQSFLEQRGVHVDVELIADLIESEVHRQITAPTAIADTPEARQLLIDKAIEAAVLAAEQSGLTGIIQNVGEQKKAYALQMAKEYLALHGIEVPDSLINGLIEAQVLRFVLAARGMLPPQATAAATPQAGPPSGSGS